MRATVLVFIVSVLIVGCGTLAPVVKYCDAVMEYEISESLSAEEYQLHLRIGKPSDGKGACEVGVRLAPREISLDTHTATIEGALKIVQEYEQRYTARSGK